MTAAATPQVFAHDSAELFAGAGLRAILLPRLLPTPVLAFAVRHLGAAAGVMVTASHNPPNDNGYKVYLGGEDEGSQIVPPADAEIAAHIQRIADDGDVAALPRSLGYETARESVVDAYVAATAAVAPAPEGAEGMRWVYTAMHGVGWETLDANARGRRVSRPAAGARSSCDPDGAFPTVAFPNPEEPGAMDLAFETARSRRRRVHHRQRPRRRPPGRRDPRLRERRRLASAERQPDRAAPRLARRPRGG